MSATAWSAALASLPHGPSFRFVDRLSALDGGVRGEAWYRLRGDEAFLEGHFPGNPILPGVLLLEAIAQLGGIVAQCDPEIPPLADLRLTGVRAAKILGAATPGTEIRLVARVEGRLGPLVQIDGEAHGPDGMLAHAKITLSGTAVG